MDKKILLTLLIMAVVTCAVQVAEPAAAGTQFDRGKWTKYAYHHKITTTYYKAYKKDNNYIYTKARMYRSGNNVLTWLTILKKTNSTTIKQYNKVWAAGQGIKRTSEYQTWNPSATNYYKYVLKPEMKSFFT